MEETKKVILMSKDDQKYEVPLAVAKMSELVKEVLDEDDEDDIGCEMKEVPVPKVTSPVLKKVIEYCSYYQKERMTDIQTPLEYSEVEKLVQGWYADFVKVDKKLLFDLVAAANYMDIKPLLELTCLAVAVFLKGKSAAEMREIFNISEESSPEEEEEQQSARNSSEGESGEANAVTGGNES